MLIGSNKKIEIVKIRPFRYGNLDSGLGGDMGLNKLKSDRFGMEIQQSHYRLCGFKNVKIRPFRYGNDILEKVTEYGISG